MRTWVGTSGFAYKEWKGPFYPEDLPDAKMLPYYSGRLRTVEINNTFYRMPNRKTLGSWAEQTPDDFSFVLKVSRKISHRKRLDEAAEEMAYLTDVVGELGPKLGPMLVQTPPWLKKDTEMLGAFLHLVPQGTRLAFEFRSSSWFDDEVYTLLAAHSMALVTSDTGKDSTLAVEKTAPYGYARLRQETYDDAALGEWAERLHGLGCDDLYVFFKHEDAGAGPLMAERFVELLAGGQG